jgi:hypothetical protein
MLREGKRGGKGTCPPQREAAGVGWGAREVVRLPVPALGRFSGSSRQRRRPCRVHSGHSRPRAAPRHLRRTAHRADIGWRSMMGRGPPGCCTGSKTPGPSYPHSVAAQSSLLPSPRWRLSSPETCRTVRDAAPARAHGQHGDRPAGQAPPGARPRRLGPSNSSDVLASNEGRPLGRVDLRREAWRT